MGVYGKLFWVGGDWWENVLGRYGVGAKIVWVSGALF